MLKNCLFGYVSCHRNQPKLTLAIELTSSSQLRYKCGDFNWEDLTLLVRRSVVHGRVGDRKTDAG